MPTTRPRHVITETDDIAAALADAARAWPDARDNKNALIRRLIQTGRRAIQDSRDTSVEQRLANFDQAAGSLAGLYEPGYLDKLREDWPA
jgi:hypothetical protein